VYTSYIRCLLRYVTSLESITNQNAKQAKRRALAQAGSLAICMMEYYAPNSLASLKISFPRYGHFLSFCDSILTVTGPAQQYGTSLRSCPFNEEPVVQNGVGPLKSLSDFMNTSSFSVPSSIEDDEEEEERYPRFQPDPKDAKLFCLASLTAKSLWSLMSMEGSITDLRSELQKLLRYVAAQGSNVPAPLMPKVPSSNMSSNSSRDSYCSSNSSIDEDVEETVPSVVEESTALWYGILGCFHIAREAAQERVAAADAAIQLHDATVQFLAAHACAPLSERREAIKRKREQKLLALENMGQPSGHSTASIVSASTSHDLDFVEDEVRNESRMYGSSSPASISSHASSPVSMGFETRPTSPNLTGFKRLRNELEAARCDPSGEETDASTARKSSFMPVISTPSTPMLILGNQLAGIDIQGDEIDTELKLGESALTISKPPEAKPLNVTTTTRRSLRILENNVDSLEDTLRILGVFVCEDGSFVDSSSLEVHSSSDPLPHFKRGRHPRRIDAMLSWRTPQKKKSRGVVTPVAALEQSNLSRSFVLSSAAAAAQALAFSMAPETPKSTKSSSGILKKASPETEVATKLSFFNQTAEEEVPQSNFSSSSSVCSTKSSARIRWCPSVSENEVSKRLARVHSVHSIDFHVDGSPKPFTDDGDSGASDSDSPPQYLQGSAFVPPVLPAGPIHPSLGDMSSKLHGSWPRVMPSLYCASAVSCYSPLQVGFFFRMQRISKYNAQVLAFGAPVAESIATPVINSELEMRLMEDAKNLAPHEEHAQIDALIIALKQAYLAAKEELASFVSELV
jgi:hypothetical protein